MVSRLDFQISLMSSLIEQSDFHYLLLNPVSCDIIYSIASEKNSLYIFHTVFLRKLAKTGKTLQFYQVTL
jgi:predicted nucleic acid binding AN1-type Zn finger protein